MGLPFQPQYPIILQPTGGDLDNQVFTKTRDEFLANYTEHQKVATWYEGATAPANPVISQKWKDTSTTPPTLRRFTGTVWEVELFNASIIPQLQDYSLSLGVLTVMAKGPWVDVRAFGADPTGATSSSVAVQAAINSIGSATIFFPGNFKFATPVTLKDGQTYKGVGGWGGSVIISTIGQAAFQYPNLQFSIFEGLTFRGDGSAGCKAILQTDLTTYTSTCQFRDCFFENSLTEGIYANLILCDIENNLFGYYGSVGVSSRHIYSKGVWNGNLSNINRLKNNRFYHAKGSESVYFEAGQMLIFEGNNFEQNTCPDHTIMIKGMYTISFNYNWFEVNTGQCIVSSEVDTSATYGNYFINFKGNHWVVGGDNQYLVHNTTSADITFEHNTGTGFATVEINYGPNPRGINGVRINSDVIIYNNNFLLGYAGSLAGISYFSSLKTNLSVKGYSVSPWLEGWTTGNLLGWSKSGGGAPTWGQGSVAGYIGNSINYTCTSGGYNNFYYQLPVIYFQGKTILIKTILSRDTGTADGLYLAINTTESVPTTMTHLGPVITLATLQEVSSTYSVPIGATYLNVGFATGGAAITGRIKAFDVWLLDNTTLINPTFAR